MHIDVMSGSKMCATVSATPPPPPPPPIFWGSLWDQCYLSPRILEIFSNHSAHPVQKEWEQAKAALAQMLPLPTLSTQIVIQMM